MKKIKGGITAPKGFLAGAVTAGLKKSGKTDLALIYSDVPAVAVGVFTTNQVKAAPVLVSQSQLKSGMAQAIIANAGNANCWTGKRGLKDAWQMVNETARVLSLNPNQVLVTSTGVIAHPLPIKKVLQGIRALPYRLSRPGGRDAAQAILTTDTRVKEIAVKVGDITIGGIAKGSGMLAPTMATMHAFITTDAQIDRMLLQDILQQAVDKSFNMTSVDNCMSTNDCVFILANGVSKSEIRNLKSEKGIEFIKAIEFVCEYLAKEIARDGEGATKLMTIHATGAKNQEDARQVVKALINSFLLKAAVYGKDKNVGRILQTVGATTVKVNWDKFKFTWHIGRAEDKIVVNLAAGNYSATGWGCDLTEGYVRINAKYHT